MKLTKNIRQYIKIALSAGLLDISNVVIQILPVTDIIGR